MTLKTVPVTGTLYNPDGSAAANASVVANLTTVDTDGGVVVPTSVTTTADANGVFTLNLWPNSRGVNGSQYRVRANIPGALPGVLLLNILVTVPDSDPTVPVPIANILNRTLPSALSDAKAAMLAAQGFAQQASGASASASAAAASAAVASGAAAAVAFIYPGTYAVAPTTRPDGSVIQNGDRFVYTVDGQEYIRVGGAWTNTASSAAAAAASAAAAGTQAGNASASATAAAGSATTAANAGNTALAAAATAGAYPNTAASNVPRGLTQASVGAITAGSGGTNGTFALAWSSGNFLVNPTGTYTVAGGALTAVTITGPGLYIGATPTVPTPSFAASSGLTGAAVALTAQFLAAAGQGYWVQSSDGLTLDRYKNVAGVATSDTANVASVPTNASLNALAALKPLYSLFPDPFFKLSANNAIYQAGLCFLYSQIYTQRAWDASTRHTYGVGGWQVPAAGGTYNGFIVDLRMMGVRTLGLTTGDTISIAGRIVGSIGVAVNVTCLFFNAAGTQLSTSSASTTLTATEQTVKLNARSIPAGAAYVQVLFQKGATDYTMAAMWIVNGSMAPEHPVRRFPLAIQALHDRYDDENSAGLPKQNYELTDSNFQKQSVTGYSALSEQFAITGQADTAYSHFFGAWAESFTTPVAISFNALRLDGLNRPGDTPASKFWKSIRVVVKTHATDAMSGDSDIVAIGEFFVDPTLAVLPEMVIPLYDLDGNAKTVTQADLLATFSVGYYAITATGSLGSAYYRKGTRAAGLTTVKRGFLSNTTNTKPGFLVPWSNLATTDNSALQFVTLTGMTNSYTSKPTNTLRGSLGLTAVVSNQPGVNKPVVANAIYGIQGIESNVWWANILSSTKPVDKFASTTAGVGGNYERRFTATPTGTLNDTVTFQSVDQESGAVLDSETAALRYIASNAAAGASRKIIFLGDSLTADGTSISRVIARAAANASGVQPTMIGTLGVAPAKHEAIGSTSLASVFTYNVNNKFTPGGPGTFFNAAGYLSGNGLATPDIVVWHYGTNDIKGATTDAEAHSIMDTFLLQLDKMIGLVADGAVTSWKSVNANIVNIVALPLGPSGSQDAFGFLGTLSTARTRRRYLRNICIAAWRIRDHYKNNEANKVFTIGLNTVADPIWGWEANNVAVNGIDTGVTERRISNDIHPFTGSAYNAIGDAYWAMFNYLVGSGLA